MAEKRFRVELTVTPEYLVPAKSAVEALERENERVRWLSFSDELARAMEARLLEEGAEEAVQRASFERFRKMIQGL